MVSPESLAEQRLWSAYPRGETVQVGEQPIRAEVIRALLLGAAGAEPGHIARLSLVGARVTGRIDLASTRIDAELRLVDCSLEEGLDLANAAGTTIRAARCTFGEIHADGVGLHRLDLTGCRIGELRLRRARITNDLILRHAECGTAGGDEAPPVSADGIVVGGRANLSQLRAHGSVRLASASIDGALDLSLATITGGALDLARAIIGQRLSLEDLKCGGVVRLTGARIGDDLLLSQSHLDGEGDDASVEAAGIAVGGDVIAAGTSAAKRLNLAGARIDGTLRLHGAKVTSEDDAIRLDRANVGRIEIAEVDLGGALVLGNAVIGTDLLLLDSQVREHGDDPLREPVLVTGVGATVAGSVIVINTHVDGVVCLASATVAGRVECTSSSFTCAGSEVLDLGRATISGGVVLTDVTAAGTIRLADARLGEALAVHDCRLSAPAGEHSLDATRLAVDGEVVLVNIEAAGLRFHGARVAELLSYSDVPDLDLRRAQVETLRPDLAVRAHLAGLTYESLQTDGASVRDLLRWLHRDPAGFVPQSYEQLAAYFSGAGRAAEARKVRLHLRRAQRRTDDLPDRIGGWIVDLASGYGYAPSRAFLWLGIFFVLSGVWFSYVPPVPDRAGTSCGDVWLFSLDLVLPASPFGFSDACAAEGSASQTVSIVAQAAGYLLTIPTLAAVSRAFHR